jgi:hypothetical protein
MGRQLLLESCLSNKPKLVMNQLISFCMKMTGARLDQSSLLLPFGMVLLCSSQPLSSRNGADVDFHLRIVLRIVREQQRLASFVPLTSV